MLLVILLLYYFWAGKWDQAPRRPGWGWEQGKVGEGEEWGERGQTGYSTETIQVFFVFFWSRFGSKCSYCFTGFTYECQTMLRCLLPYQTCVNLSDAHVKTHIDADSQQQTWDYFCVLSYKTTFYCEKVVHYLLLRLKKPTFHVC